MTFVTGAMSPASRRDTIAALAEKELDVLVIGAGVVGAGIALDAVSRGLSVGIVEARDMASGTSSRSTKLVHGGLRYLKQLGFPLVFEALRERSLILDTLCPHLVKPVEFIYPLGEAGLGPGLRRHRRRGVRRARCRQGRALAPQAPVPEVDMESFPGAKRGTVHGGIKFYEGQLDDARHTMMLDPHRGRLRGAGRHQLQVVGFLRNGQDVVGAKVRDLETGKDIEVRAKCIVNATGVWTDEIQHMIGGKGGFRVLASKGVHIVVPRDRIPSKTGLIPRPRRACCSSSRGPGATTWVIGTTDTPWNLDLAHPVASEADIEYVLEHVNRLLESPLTKADIVGVYAGLRPLLAGESDDTSKVSREHTWSRRRPGWWSSRAASSPPTG